MRRLAIHEALGAATAAGGVVCLAILGTGAFPRSAAVVTCVIAMLLAGLYGAAPATIAFLRGRPATGTDRAAWLRGALRTFSLTAVAGWASWGALGLLKLEADGARASYFVARVACFVLGAIATIAAARFVARRLEKPQAVPAARAVTLSLAPLVAASIFAGGRTADPARDSATSDSRRGLKVAVIAVDGLGTDLLKTYADEMPNLVRLAETAARGSVVTPPPHASVPIWSSIAMGVPLIRNTTTANYEIMVDGSAFGTVPLDHLTRDPISALLMAPAMLGWRTGWVSVVPASRFHLRGVPFWALPEAGHSAVVCWTGTWPAAPFGGVLVTDWWAPGLGQETLGFRSRGDGITWPPSLEERLRELAPAKEAGGYLEAAWQNVDACFSAATTLRAEEDPVVLAVYTEGLDEVRHLLTSNASAADGERDPALANALVRFDEKLGALLAALDGAETLIVVGDHGMARAQDRLFLGMWHSGDGLILVRGDRFGAKRDLGALRPEEIHTLIVESL